MRTLENQQTSQMSVVGSEVCGGDARQKRTTRGELWCRGDGDATMVEGSSGVREKHRKDGRLSPGADP